MTWYELFPRILNMSLTASVIICFVLLCRLLLKMGENSLKKLLIQLAKRTIQALYLTLLQGY